MRSRQDDMVEDVVRLFGLGAMARPLLREVVQLITGSPGGIGGFIDKLRSAGFGSHIASWLGRTDGPALSADDVKRVIGCNVLQQIASRLGVSRDAAGAATGNLLPKLVGQMTPGGIVPAAAPSWIPGYVGQAGISATEQMGVR
jgi:OmpA-OmpF porin, OOP family